MKTIAAVYDSHKKAYDALKTLKDAHFPEKQISLVGKAEEVNGELHIKSLEQEEVKTLGTPVGVGAVAGSVAGLLTGVGIFAIPGFGFLYGAGAVLGAIAGFEFGAIGGTFAAVLSALGIHSDYITEYEKYINEGKILLVVHGNQDEIQQVQDLLSEEGAHLHLQTH